MSRADRVAYLLNRFGNKAQWNGQTLHILLRPTQTGERDCRRYFCIAPAAFLPYVGDAVTCLENTYTVLRADGKFVQGERVYSTAVLELNDRWGR